MKIKEYKIVGRFEEPDVQYDTVNTKDPKRIYRPYDDFMKNINHYISKGYEPYGYPFTDDGQLLQAMVKYEEEE